MVVKLFFAGIILYFIYILLGYVFTAILRVPAYLKGTYICMFVFSNNALMGYPVVQALFGDVAIFYITIFNMAFNVLFFTISPHYIKKDAAIEAHQTEMEKPKVRDFINNGLLAGIAALVIYFGNIRLPDIFYSCVSFVGNITTPLSMIIIGSSLATVSLKQIRSSKGIWMMLPIRLGVIPLIVFFYMHLFTSDPMLISIGTIGAGMPVASLVSMITAQYPRQNQTATIGVALSTIVSMVSIPIMVALLNLAG